MFASLSPLPPQMTTRDFWFFVCTGRTSVIHLPHIHSTIPCIFNDYSHSHKYHVQTRTRQHIVFDGAHPGGKIHGSFQMYVHWIFHSVAVETLKAWSWMLKVGFSEVIPHMVVFGEVFLWYQIWDADVLWTHFQNFSSKCFQNCSAQNLNELIFLTKL